VTQPAIVLFHAQAPANGVSLLIVPGGAYARVAIDKEGFETARWFAARGFECAVLRYRLPADGWAAGADAPVLDGLRALRLLRSRQVTATGAAASRLGVIGFSAGGHLASTIDTHFDKVVIDNKNNISLRPDFAMLIYPVISFGPFAHAFSRENLIGKNPSQQLIDFYSNEKQVTANTPPTFLIHAEDDDVVPVQNSLLFYDALVKNKIKAEMHLFQAGGHGFGLNNPTTTDHWFDWAANWLRGNGF
jgi:acetyl esterase/lipase